jgi:long-subunit fatty acid transport protein
MKCLIIIFTIALWSVSIFAAEKITQVPKSSEVTKEENVTELATQSLDTQDERNFIIGLQAGATRYTGNRGKAYDEDLPMYGVSFKYKLNQDFSFGVGYQRSESNIFIEETIYNLSNYYYIGDTQVNIQKISLQGEMSILKNLIENVRPYFGSNISYWIVESEFFDHQYIEDEVGGGFGIGATLGVDWQLNKRFHIGMALDYDIVNFSDEYTQNYNFSDGYEDLSGDPITISFNMGIHI